jgi:NAD(P)-dependent dehydrogenase (short-subunit alcohol dehydrogenase family)
MLVPERRPSKIDHASALATLTLNLLSPMMLAKHFTPLLLPKKSRPTDTNTKNKKLTTENTNSNSNSITDSIPGLPPPGLSVLAFMSARVGSISDNRLGGWFSYRASKAGLNQLVKSLDIYLRTASGAAATPMTGQRAPHQQQPGNSAGIGAGVGARAICIGMHPGTVKTDLSREFWESTASSGKLFEPGYAAERLLGEGVLGGLTAEMGGRCWGWDGMEILP